MEQQAIRSLRKLDKIATPKMSNRNPTVVSDRESNVHVAKNSLQLHSVHIVLLGLRGPLRVHNQKSLFPVNLSAETPVRQITV
jgi:hypothetical protein